MRMALINVEADGLLTISQWGDDVNTATETLMRSLGENKKKEGGIMYIMVVLYRLLRYTFVWGNLHSGPISSVARYGLGICSADPFFAPLPSPCLAYEEPSSWCVQRNW